PAVSVVAFAALGLTFSTGRVPESARRLSTTGRISLGLAAIALIGAEVLPAISERSLNQSRKASARGDLSAAATYAAGAHAVEPWAATPYLQLALVGEQAGALSRAVGWVDRAINRDPRDWRLRLVAARLETKLGRFSAAERRLTEARRLNPRAALPRQSSP